MSKMMVQQMAQIMVRNGVAKRVANVAAADLAQHNYLPQHVKKAYAEAPYRGYHPISKEVVDEAIARAGG